MAATSSPAVRLPTCAVCIPIGCPADQGFVLEPQDQLLVEVEAHDATRRADCDGVGDVAVERV